MNTNNTSTVNAGLRSHAVEGERTEIVSCPSLCRQVSDAEELGEGASRKTCRTRKAALVEANGLLRGVRVKWNAEYEEYRVNVVGGKEATAYYTTDICDAVGTGEMMANYAARLAPEVLSNV